MKRYNVMFGVGKSYALVNYHNGISKHEDGSDFFDIAVFGKNEKRKFKTFCTALDTKGFVYGNR